MAEETTQNTAQKPVKRVCTEIAKKQVQKAQKVSTDKGVFCHFLAIFTPFIFVSVSLGIFEKIDALKCNFCKIGVTRQ
jgi:hypothetical protein